MVEVLKICHIGEIKANHVEMSNAKVTFIHIVNRIPDTYNTNEGWVVKKMRSKYVNRIVAIFPIIYQKDKVQYFNKKIAMMISKANHGESINWVAIMYFQLVKELIKWEKVLEKHE